NLYASADRLADAEFQHLHALEIRQQMVSEHPGVPAYRRDLAIAHHNLGSLSLRMGRPAKGEAHFKQAMEEQRKLVLNHPGGAQYRDDLASTHSSQGAYAKAGGRLKDAETEFRRALEFREKLAAEHPGIVRYRVQEIHSLWDLASVLIPIGRLTEA